MESFLQVFDQSASFEFPSQSGESVPERTPWAGEQSSASELIMLARDVADALIADGHDRFSRKLLATLARGGVTAAFDLVHHAALDARGDEAAAALGKEIGEAFRILVRGIVVTAAKGSDLLEKFNELQSAIYEIAAQAQVTLAQSERSELQQEIGRLSAENARLQHSDDALVARVSELVALQKVNNAVNSTLDLSEVLAQTVEFVSNVNRADVCSIFLYEEARDELVLSASRGLNQAAIGQVTLRIGEGLTGAAALEGRPIAVRDAWSDARFKYAPGLEEEPYHSMVCVPIVLYTVNKLIGVLSLHTRDFRDFTPEEIRFLETVAGQIAIAIENARHYGQTDEKLRQKVNQLTTLQRVSSLIASTLDLQQVLSQIASLVVELIGADMSAIYRTDEATGDMAIVASHGLSQEYARSVVIRPGEGVLGTAVATGRPVAVSDALGDSRFSNLGQRASLGGYRSICSVPLVAKQKAIGGISIYYRSMQQFTDDQIRLLSAFADQAAVAIENAQLYEQARRGLVTKSALLMEMHHRVKNNLQTVAALLSLQQRRAKSTALAQPLGESIARIQSIAAVHDLLSSEQVGQVTVGDLLKPIIEVATVNLVPPGKRVDFVIEGQHVMLGSKEANVLALLLNELTANAIRHGFARSDRGVITISAADDGEHTMVRVGDDGAGLPTEFDLERDAGLGLQIVQTLVRNDLRGEFDVCRAARGSVAQIKFACSAIPFC